MVPLSRSENGCCIKRNAFLSGLLDSVKKPLNNQQGRPSHEGFDLGGGVGFISRGDIDADKKNEEEHKVNFSSSSDDGFLAPSSPALAAFLPPAHEGVGFGGRDMKNETKDFGSGRAPARNGFVPQNGVAGLVAKVNGIVGGSEKRMRNGEGIPSSSSSPRSSPLGDLNTGKGKESIAMGGGGYQDCPEAPLRKRVHVEENCPVDTLDGGVLHVDLGKVNRHVDSESGNCIADVESPTGWKEESLFDSEERKGRGLPARVPPTPARTEGNGEAVVEARGEGGRRLIDGERDVEMAPEEEPLEVNLLLHLGNDDHLSVPVQENGHPSVPDVTDMDVDELSSSENYEILDDVDVVDEAGSPAADEQFDDESQQAIWERNVGAAGASPPLFGDVFEEMRRGVSSSSTDHSPSRRESTPPPPGEDEGSQGNAQRDLPHARRTTDVEVIEFDDSDDEEAQEVNGVHESDGSSTKGKKPISQHREQRRRNGYGFSSSESTAPSFNSKEGDSDSDDCQVLGSRPPAYGHNRQAAGQPVVVEDDDDENYTTTEEESDSSDVEEVAGSQSEIRRRWEEAAMRRRMGRAMQSAGSKANGGQGATINLEDDRTESQGLEESVATSTYRDSPDSKDQTETSQARGGSESVVHRADLPQGTSATGDEERRPVGRAHSDDATLNGVNEIPDTPADPGMANGASSSGPYQGDINRPSSVGVEIPGVTELEREETQSREVPSEEANSASADQNDDERSQSKKAVDEGFQNGATESPDVDTVGHDAETRGTHEDLIAAKEKLKQTDQYRKTDAAEWASRQQEIQRQALESKKLRQRKRQEADRKREMERKQKERIEELRLTQMKEEKNMDLRDQLRGQVRTELERVAATCGDFATLLRQLGIPVEGGSHPSTQQVNAAYKKALFKFHPDRAVASSKGEPRYQVEAEEKFKLIQRLKDTLAPVANDYTFPTYRSFF